MRRTRIGFVCSEDWRNEVVAMDDSTSTVTSKLSVRHQKDTLGPSPVVQNENDDDLTVDRQYF